MNDANDEGSDPTQRSGRLTSSNAQSNRKMAAPPWMAGAQAQAAHARKEIALWEPLPQPADNMSTYSSHYQKWPLPSKKTSCKPKDERPMSASRFDTRSTMQDSFQNWSGNHRPRSCRPSSAYEPKAWMQPISSVAAQAGFGAYA